MSDPRFDQLRVALQLSPHPEGGHYREHYRGAEGGRGSSTAIWFLLGDGDFSAWHRVEQDELWHHYDGAEVELHLLDEAGYRVLRLGPVGDGVEPCRRVPGGTWQAARPVGGYALVGATVAPGFLFEEFVLADPETLRTLEARHPAAAAALRSLSRA